MAEDQAGLRKDPLKELAPWSRLFSAFKIALDPKKLLLAAAGILTMALGWYVLAVVFFAFAGKPPSWRNDYPAAKSEDKEKNEIFLHKPSAALKGPRYEILQTAINVLCEFRSCKRATAAGSGAASGCRRTRPLR